MKKFFSTICLLIITLFIYSCKKGESTKVPPFDWQAIEKCNDALNLDTSEIANRLIGQWEMKLWRCGFCATPGSYLPDKTVIATFTSARQFSVTENSITVAQGNWDLKMHGSNRWELQSDSTLAYLNGFILFCNNQVLFEYSYIDGPDNLFEKVN